MLKFDDQYPLHRKVAALSDSAFRLVTEAIFWSRRNLTDGFVPTEDIAVVSRARDPGRACAEAVRRGLWHRVVNGLIVGPADNRNTGDGISEADPDLSGRDRETPARQVSGCAECSARHNGSLAGNGFVIHGYADWNETRSKVLHVRSIRAAAGKEGGIASGKSRRRQEATPKQVAEAALPKQRTPRPPRPPTGGSGRARARGAAAPTIAKHGYEHDDQCGVCAVCSMPEANAAHKPPRGHPAAEAA